MAGNQKYCPSCGNSNPTEAAFCLSCGSKFPAFTPQGVGAATPQQQAIPPAPHSDFITLSCPSCGGKLNITSDIDRFACQFCGHEHIVRRSGGMVSLEPVMQVMKSIDTNINLVGVGVNKLGFSSEKQVAEQTITRLKGEIANISSEIGQYDNSSGCGTAAGTMMGIGFFALLILAIAKGWSFWLILLFLGLIGLMVYVIVLALKPDPKLKALKEELAKKQAELERNYEIVRQI
jgi:hypothetical protein